MRSPTLLSALVCVLFFVVGLLVTATHVQAEPPSFSRGEGPGRYGGVDRPREDRSRDDRKRYNSRDRRYRYDDHSRTYRYPYRAKRSVPAYRDYRYHRYRYPRYYAYPQHYHYHSGNDFLGWLAFTTITLAIIDSLSEQQQHQHELALRDALRAPVGETIHWNDYDAYGSVTVIRDGTSSTGRYCREYTQEIKIGSEAQRAYGTACRNADGSWEIVN